MRINKNDTDVKMEVAGVVSVKKLISAMLQD